jgi:hypothetical protein
MRQEASASFLKKRSKKLLFLCSLRVARTVPHALSQSKKVFLFCRLRVALSSPHALSQVIKFFCFFLFTKRRRFLIYF